MNDWNQEMWWTWYITLKNSNNKKRSFLLNILMFVGTCGLGMDVRGVDYQL